MKKKVSEARKRLVREGPARARPVSKAAPLARGKKKKVTGGQKKKF